jgi:3-isopropylmalate/(R)-2-methylmalate dehydratase small subunit
VEKCVITDEDGFSTSFQVDQYRRHCLINGLDDIDVTLQYEEQIARYEDNVPSYYRVSSAVSR